MKKIKHTLKSIYLCIKYPFLYPRNRFNDKHHNNWKLNKLSAKLEIKAFNWQFSPYDGYCDKSVNSYWNVFLYYCLNIVIWFNRLFHCIPTYTEWDAIPEGWAKAFGKQYLKELGEAVKTLPKNIRKDFRILDIKEKYGNLRVYTNFGNYTTDSIINKYEHLSYYTCIKCGKLATKLSGGWICPYCDDCIGDKFIIANNKDMDWKFIEDDYE